LDSARDSGPHRYADEIAAKFIAFVQDPGGEN
jgi:hypothetical protein